MTGFPDRNDSYYKPFYRDIVLFNQELSSKIYINDRHLVLTDDRSVSNSMNFLYGDIWIRDVAPVITTRLVKFVYNPDYLPLLDSNYLNRRFSNWLKSNKFKVIYSDIILDGGNFSWNKKDAIVVTSRIITDNKRLTKEKIISELKLKLDIDKVIIIPIEQGDRLAHTDGMIKFIDEKRLFISDFQGDETFRKKVEEIILIQIPDAEFIIMPSFYTEDDQYDNEILSAKGLYINILETDNGFYFPQFGLKQDKKVLDFVKKYLTKQVIPISVDKLSTMGGATNCLTWYCPPEFIPIKFNKNRF